ncbi:MAG: sensor histidine kinase, partial [Microvirga sp.]
SARIMVGSVVRGEVIGPGDLMEILDEASQLMDYSRRLEQKSEALERATAELKEAYDRLRQLDRLKDEFVATVSHELRTPLTSIRSFSEILLDTPDLSEEERRHFLGIVVRESDRLTRLVNDVLDLSKIEAGQLTLALDDYSVGQVVQTVLSGTESLAKAKGLALTARVQEGLPIGRGDERRLTQVLLNLVGNAIKFTDKGSVEIAAGAADGFFDIAVRDTGPGIAPDDQKRIFEEFQQVDSSSTRQKGGTGLGLAISQRLVEMHGGTIAVESVLGEGSTFRIAVPVRAAERMEAA